jgi:hypothetical protein
MMKYVATVLLGILVSMPSQAKMTPTERVFQSQKQHALNIQTQTKSVLVHALPKTHRKFVVTNDLTDDDTDDLPGPDELDLQVLYRRPRIVDTHRSADDTELSDYVKTRLLIARARAMQAYNKSTTFTKFDL